MSSAADPRRDSLLLKPLQVSDLPALLEVPESGLTLGRDPSNRVAIDGSAFPQVSAFHARVSLAGGGLEVEDLGSKNGTLVNGGKVPRSILRAGDLLQLGGPNGPRFLVVSPNSPQTTLVLPGTRPAPPTARFGASTIVRLRSALGIPAAGTPPAGVIPRRLRFLIALIGAALVLGLSIGGIAFHYLDQAREADRARLQELETLNQKLNRLIQGASAELLQQRQVWESEKGRLHEERAQLLEKIAGLEKNGRASSEEIQGMRSRLEETTVKLEMYNPVHLEKEKQARREQLQRAVGAVVYIEKQVIFREDASREVLHYEVNGEGEVQINIEGRGERLSKKGSGSGFCVSADGWIITNAHVVSEGALESFEYQDWSLKAEAELAVVFSSTSERRPARLVKALEDRSEDLALLKIEPFEGMPHLDGLDPESGAPPAGTEVWLFGFPLGMAIQEEGKSLTASVFRGIVSRQANPYLQVQAAVYPGNSGGPVVDEHGRVVGVVTAVLATPTGQIASDIGYIIPVAAARGLWPPE